ncbi:MAG: hypothetical protein WDA11_10280 [Thiohalomonadaceae bacterium]
MNRSFIGVLVVSMILSSALSVFANDKIDTTTLETPPTVDVSMLKNMSMEDIIELNEKSVIDKDLLREALLIQEWESYSNDPEFQRLLNEDPEDANRMIEENVNNQIEFFFQVTPKSWIGETEAWSAAPLIQQYSENSCGPCSALQAILGWGGSVAGSDNVAKQITIENVVPSPANAYDLRMHMNDDYSPPEYISAKKGSEMTDLAFKWTLFNSLMYDVSPILHAMTGQLSYYNGHNSRHYICVQRVDFDSSNPVRLRDCNWRSEYFGSHYVTLADAKAAVSQPDRYLLAAKML